MLETEHQGEHGCHNHNNDRDREDQTQIRDVSRAAQPFEGGGFLAFAQLSKDIGRRQR
jgi:hypothetical protein